MHRVSARVSARLMCRICLLALVGVSVMASCTKDTSAPTAPIVPPAVSLSIAADVSGTAISTMVVRVTGPGISDTLVFNLSVSNGIASGAIQVPTGSARVFSVHGFDSKGIETDSGSVTLDIRAGTNPTVTVTLTPLAGTQPITVTIGRVLVRVVPGIDTVNIGDTLRLRAIVTDSAGDTLRVPATWGSANPSIIAVDTTGLVLGKASGTTQVVAVYGTVAGSAMVTVQAAASASWIQLSPAGPAPAVRYDHSAVYDAANDRMIVFGGIGTSLDYNDTWVLQQASGSGGTPSWTQLTTVGGSPSVRHGHTAVYDAANNRMIVFDGSSMNDVWVLSNANGLGGTPTWTQLSPTGGPAARTYHSAVYDSVGNRMIIFGGNLSEGYCFNEANDTWVLSNANGLGGTPAWSQLSPAGGPPSIRNLGGALYDPASNRMTVLWGRVECSGGVTTDLWTLIRANGIGGTPAWSQLTASGAATPRAAFSTVYDATSQRATIFGGFTSTAAVNDVWVLSDAVGQTGTSGWTQVVPAGTAPSARNSHSAVYNATQNRMIVFGGYPSNNEVWVLTHANGQ